MTEKTSNHDLNLYNQGDENWTHTPDMATIEERLIVRDVESNRENYKPHDAAIFIATDTGAVYDGNGDSWKKADRSYDRLEFEDGDFGTVSDPLSSITNTHYCEETIEASVSGDHVVNLESANVHKLTLTSDTSISFTGSHPDMTTGVTLIIQQDSTGGHDLDWDEEIYWANGAEPNLSSNADDRHKLVFENVAGEWDGAVVGENFILVDASLIDDFKDGDISEYSGDTGAYSVTTNTPVYQGDYSLKITAANGVDRIVSTSGLDNYPAQGDTFAAWLQLAHINDNRPGVLFGAQDYNNHYIARIVQGSTDYNDSIQIATRESGSFTVQAQTDIVLSADTWYDCQVDWQSDDTIVFTVYDDAGTEQASASWSDANSLYATDTGFGWYQGVREGAATFDNARLL